MDSNIETLKRVYERFNARDIDGVLAVCDANVAWANGMEGGHVQGCDGLRAYWTRQWSVVSPHVEPVSFTPAGKGAILVEVRQTVRDLEGNPLEGQTHGLKDKTVGHVFHFRNGKVIRFDIREDA